MEHINHIALGWAIKAHGILARYLTVTLLVIGCCFYAPESAALQNDDYGKVWVQKKPIVRRKTKRVEQAPLLTLRWQLLTTGDNKAGQPVDPKTQTFSNGEQVGIAVQINQHGFLYVINHTVKNDKSIEGPFLIPGGQYEVEENQQVVLPPICPEHAKKDGKCWWKMQPPAGREVVTLIFSREKIEEWATASTTDFTRVDESQLHSLTREVPAPQSKPWTLAMQRRSNLKGIRGEHVVMTWNSNPRDNELLVERIEFNHK